METLGLIIPVFNSYFFSPCDADLFCCLQLLASCPYRAGYPGISTG
jgi:hypothetical protein